MDTEKTLTSLLSFINNEILTERLLGRRDVEKAYESIGRLIYAYLDVCKEDDEPIYICKIDDGFSIDLRKLHKIIKCDKEITLFTEKTQISISKSTKSELDFLYNSILEQWEKMMLSIVNNVIK